MTDQLTGAAAAARRRSSFRAFRRDRRAMHASHTRKMQAIAELKREYEPVEQVFAPHREIMRQRGLTPRALIEGWADVERRLAEGDGVNVIKGIVAGYNIDPARIADALGIGAARQTADAGASKPAAAPASPALPADVLQEIARLPQRAEAEDRAKAETARLSQAAAQQKFLTELDAFRNARDDQGNLLHPHFSDLEEDMAHLALAAEEPRTGDPTVARALRQGRPRKPLDVRSATHCR